MLSIALFPCSYTDGARLVGELSNALQAKMYTDALLLEDASRQYNLSLKEIKRWLYGPPFPDNSRTLEKNKYVNLFKRFILENLSIKCSHMFYGYLASLVGPGVEHVFKILVVDSREARVRRAMLQEGCTRSIADEIITKHDCMIARWTQFLFNKEPYDYSLYDSVISYDSRNMLVVKDEILELCRQHQLCLTNEILENKVQEMKIAAAVERVLLERGYKAGVSISGGSVELSVEVSEHNYSWLAHKLKELSRSVHGVEEVTVARVI